MNLLTKIFKRKKRIMSYIEFNGMAEAVKKYSISKLCKYKILENYKATELYYDFNPYGRRVFDKNGKLLGQATIISNSLDNSIGEYIAPCSNGVIVLNQFDKEKETKTYGIFDKNGNQLLDYGIYYEICILPNGIALTNYFSSIDVNVITVDFEGDIVKQNFTHIKECFFEEAVEKNLRSYKLYLPEEDQVEFVTIHLDENGKRVDLDKKVDIENLNQ